jgi:hypothetical protein
LSGPRALTETRNMTAEKKGAILFENPRRELGL